MIRLPNDPIDPAGDFDKKAVIAHPFQPLTPLAISTAGGAEVQGTP